MCEPAKPPQRLIPKYMIYIRPDILRQLFPAVTTQPAAAERGMTVPWTNVTPSRPTGPNDPRHPYAASPPADE